MANQYHSGSGDNVAGNKIVHYHFYGKEVKVPKYLNRPFHIQVEDVIGRAKDVEIIRTKLFDEKQLLIMNAMGGIGKTTTALYYAETYRDHYQHILWIDGSKSIEEYLSSNREIHTSLGMTERVNQFYEAKQYDQISHEVIRNLAALETPVLWLIDNAADFVRNQCRMLAQSLPKHHFLFTSRETDENINAYPLQYLSPEAALQLFYRWAKRIDSSPENDALLNALLEKIKCHTLSLVILAKTFENKKGSTLAQFCETYTQALLQPNEKIKISIDNNRDKQLGYEILLRLFDTSDIVINKPALDLLRKFAVFPSQQISYTDLETILCADDFDTDDLSNALQDLLRAGWLEESEDMASVYFCHPLIQGVIKEIHQIDYEEIKPVLIRLMEVLQDNNNNHRWWKNEFWLLYSHALLGYFEEYKTELIVSLYSSLAFIYTHQGIYETALTFYQKALDIQEKVLGISHPDTGTTYNNIALVYDHQGKYKKSLNFLYKALDIRKKVLVSNHPSIATTYNNIAGVYNNQGNYTDALTYYQKALDIREKVLSATHPDIAGTYNNIALVYEHQGKYDESLMYYKKSLCIGKEVLGAAHPNTAKTYNNTAAVYLYQGKYEEALTYFQKALDIQEKVLGLTHPDTATTYNNIASVYDKQSKYEDALNFFQKALEIHEKVLGTEHPDTATTYNNIGLVYDHQSKYEEALTYYQKVLDIQEKVLGVTHPDTAATYNNIASVYDNQGKYEDALTFYKKALEIHEKVLGTEHPDTAVIYNNIAMVYDHQGKYNQAFPIFQKCLLILKKVLPVGHPNIKGILSNYRSVLMAAKDRLSKEEVQMYVVFVLEHFREYMSE